MCSFWFIQISVLIRCIRVIRVQLKYRTQMTRIYTDGHGLVYK